VAVAAGAAVTGWPGKHKLYAVLALLLDA
jgi:hypothetical protein